MSIESDIYGKSIGLGRSSDSGTSYSLSPDTEKLLQAALEQGGATAQVAAELVHPNGAFLLNAKDKLKDSFIKVMDVLAIPSNGIAALMDQDLTWKEARDKNIMPSDIVFRGIEKPEDLAGKAAYFGGRLFTDILLDPLTYVTFGTSAGIFGISKLTQISLKGGTAAKLGLATTLVRDSAGNMVEEAVKNRSVTKAGLEKLQDIQSWLEGKLKQDTIDSFYSDTNISNRLQRVANNLATKSTDDISTFMKRTSSASKAETTAEYVIAEKLREFKIQVPNATVDQINSAKSIAIKEAMDEQAERLARYTVSARRADIEYESKEMLSNLIERNVKSGGKVVDNLGREVTDSFGRTMVRDLAKEFVDAGGVKFFGHSIISGARIRSSLSIIPSISFVDRHTEYMRNVVGSAFSNNWTSEGRTPDSLIQIMERARNKQTVKNQEVFSFLPSLYEKLKITKEEDKLISAAIALDKAPVDHPDSRLFTLWSMIRSADGNILAKDIAAGRYGTDEVRMWRAATALKNQLKKNLITMHESGIAAFPQKNYIPGFLNERFTYKNPFTKFKTSKAVNAEKAELVKWRSVSNPETVQFGTEDSLQLKKISKVEEKNRIEETIRKEVTRYATKKAKVEEEIKKAWDSITEVQVASISKTIKPIVRSLTKDQHNILALQQLISEAIPAVDRRRVLTQYVSEHYEDGIKLFKQQEGITTDDIESLSEMLAFGDMELDTVANEFVKKLKSVFVPETKKTSATLATKRDNTQIQKMFQQLQDNILKIGLEGKRRYMRDILGGADNQKVLDDVLSSLSEAWHKDPEGIGLTLEKILGKEFELRQLMEDLSDVKTALELELKQPGLKMAAGKWFYIDKKGEAWERVRATAKEINDNYFNGEEMFTESALKATLGGTLNAIRAASSQELLDDIAKKWGVPASAAPSNFVQLGIAGLDKEAMDMRKFFQLTDGKLSLKASNGEELFFHPTVAESVNKMMVIMAKDPASSELAAAFDKMTNIWKSSVTAIWPAFHGRNAISNVFQHYLDLGIQSFNPTNHVNAGRLIKYASELDELALNVANGDSNAMRQLLDLEKRTLFTDGRGYEWSIGELVQQIRKNVVAFDPNIIGQTDVMLSPREALDEVMEELYPQLNKYGAMANKHLNPFRRTFVPFKYGRQAGNLIEWQARIVDFLGNLKATGDVQHATMQTKRFLFDYQNLTPFERNFMRRLVPFYAYSRKNFSLQAKVLFTTPGRTEAIFSGFRNLGEVMSGGSLSEEERNLLPDWMRGGLNMVYARDKEHVALITTAGTPIEQPYQQINNLVGSLHPVIKGAVEQATGYSFFYGRPLSDVTDATGYASPLVPKAIKDFIGLTKVTYTTTDGREIVQWKSLRPKQMNLFNMLPAVPRVISTLKTMESQSISDQQKSMQLLFGMKTNDINLELEADRREQELKAELEHILDQAGIGYTFERFELK